MITFTKTTYTEQQELFNTWLQGMNGVNDDFWEEHVLGSQFYLAAYNGKPAGLAAIHNACTLTVFYITQEYLRYAQDVFAALLARLQPPNAFAATNDELLLAQSLENSKGFALQARFFQEGAVPVRPAEYPRALLRPATLADAESLLDENPEESIKAGKYFVLEKNGQFLGQGFINRSTLHPGVASIGMSVHPDHRRKNIGRSIMLHMRAYCHEQGLIPICGCWYYNTASWRTLQSAGFVGQTRLLNIGFREEEQNAENT